MGEIVWLSSYPKSGNTWLRALLTSYLDRGNSESVSLDQLVGSHGATTELFESFTSLEPSELSDHEIDHYRPLVYRRVAAGTSDLMFMKVHDENRRTPDGSALFPADATRAAVYLIRNPLDVAVSWAHHKGCDFEEASRDLCDDGFKLGVRRGAATHQVPQTVGSWSRHVDSWVQTPNFAVHVVRYEDLIAAPAATFASVLRFLGYDVVKSRVTTAVRAASFHRLQAAERAHGFWERSPRTVEFFRRGVSGEGRMRLSPHQQARIINAHARSMERFGY